jgi:hypothetical protein
MFACGLFNNIGIGVFLAYTSSFASLINENYNFAMFCVLLQTVPILAVFMNAAFLITINHDIRLLITCIIFILSYILFAFSVTYSSLMYAVVACIVH